MDFADFSVSSIQRIATTPDGPMFMGSVEIGLSENVAGRDIIQRVKMTVRVTTKTDANFETLERTLFERAKLLLGQMRDFLQEETVESLRQRS